MEDLKYLTNKNNVVQISVALQKVCKLIREAKKQNTPEKNIKEIDFLREQFASENIQLCLLSYQSFVRLVEDGTLETPNVLTMFISMLPSANLSQYTAISEGVISLLLLDLKRRSVMMKGGNSYICPFGIKPPQHPLIMLLQKKEANMNDLANKINGICNHHDKEIQKTSIEFLRPVFLYILCNPIIIQDSKTIWTCLLSHSKNSQTAHCLVYEILVWTKISSPASALYTSILLTEAIDFMVNQKNFKSSIEFTVYLAAVLNNLISFGYDPRPSLAVLLRVLHESHVIAEPFYNVLLILLSKILHKISPIYIADITRVLKFIIVTRCGGNSITLNMVVDGLILWVANPAFIASDGVTDAQLLIEFIKSDKCLQNLKQRSTVKMQNNVKYFHVDIALSYDLALFSDRINDDITKSKFDLVDSFVNSLTIPRQITFCNTINLFLRGLFLCNNIPSHISLGILKVLINVVKINEHVAIDFILPLLYKLSREVNPNVQLEILRGLTSFAVVKENIPIILNTINSLSTGPLRTLSMDLYLRLWKCEGRTYPFLHKLLSATYDKDRDSWEKNVSKAYTIKEICLLKPAQHGTDLVTHLSNILNNCAGNKGDAATSIAFDAIVILCNSHTINVTSTWKALSVKFQNEKRVRSAKSLCHFFGKIPLLRSPTMEYEQLYTESIERLWRYVIYSDKQEIITAALNALRNFNHNDLTLKQIPDIFRQNIVLPSEYTKTPIDAARDPVDVLSYIPAECWRQLIQNVNHCGIEAAADLVAHYIHIDINSYRGGVYLLPDGKPEPTSLSQLHRRSPLRGITSFLIYQSKSSNINEIVVQNCLRSISKKFPKSIPPLNWFFLLEFINRSVEMKKYCLRIATNQIPVSGTAKTLIEHYLKEFDVNMCSEEEIVNILELIPDISNGVSVDILIPFIEFILDYTYNLSISYEEGCLFEIALKLIKPVFTQKSLINENVEGIAAVIQTYMEIINIDSKIFQKYTEFCCCLPSHVLDSMTSPNTWWEISTEKFKKATIIRCYLAQHNNTLENSLIWLNPIIDNVTKSNVEHTFVLRYIANVLHRYENDKNACTWLMDYLSKIQSLMSDKTTNNDVHCLFMFDVFILSIGVISDYALFSNIDAIADSRQNRLDLLPEGLHALCTKQDWQDSVIRIYEFFYHIYMHSELPSYFKEATKNALICSKNQSYFLQKNIWMKYVGLRK